MFPSSFKHSSLKHLYQSPGVQPLQKLSDLSAISEILNTWITGAHYGEQCKEAAKRIQGFLANSSETKLILTELELTKLPYGLCKILSSVNRLQHLSLSHNQLTMLPSDFGNLTTLQHLDLSFNQLIALPDSMKNLSKLQRFSLSRNQLTRLPDCFGNFTALRVLNLSENKLTSVSDIGELTMLQWLNLSQNQLRKLPSDMKNLTTLQWLDLSENYFSALPDCIEGLTELQYLDLSENHLAVLSDKIGSLIKLQELILSDNKLTTLSDRIKNLTALKVLELSQNQLTILPNGALQLPHDCKIDLTDCPLLSPIQSQLQQLAFITDCHSPRIRLPTSEAKSIHESTTTEKTSKQMLIQLPPKNPLKNSTPKTWTVIIVKCQDVPNGDSIYIRGSGAGINWQSGTKLNQIDWETFEFRTNTLFSEELEFKLLLNDDKSDWEEGNNHTIAQGKKLKVVPVFPSVPILKKTVIELEYPVPEDKTLYLSGTGPLGNWDRKVPMSCSDDNRCSWFIRFDGEFSDFEYKIRLDDQWEGRWDNRKIACGRKGQIKSPRF